MAPFLLLFPLLLLLSLPSVQAQQNIALGSSLTPQGPDKLWLSPSGDFAFRFQPVHGNSSFYLLAVWFNQISDQTVAWYAKTTDREPVPVQVSSGACLQITSAGSLSLQDPTGTEVWNPKASMLDSGNFVLVHANGPTKWETFNNPVDTILLNQILTPGMTLRSRIIPTDYSNGRFLLNLQTDGVGLYLVAVPSGNQYTSYWYRAGNTTNLVFDATGRIYIAMDNGKQLNMTSGVPGSMEQYYHRATSDTDGVFRQYRHLKISA